MAPVHRPRRWRRGGRRAQVAPVATILGLLLVVTFIANYLTTTLPGQMSANDLNHETQVENQIGTLSALLTAVSLRDIQGAEVSQTITLGTSATPPFAGSDSSTLSRGNMSGRFTVNFPELQPLAYNPPNAGPETGDTHYGTCAPGPPATSVTCSSPYVILWNYTGALANQASYMFSISGSGLVQVHIIANGSTIQITGSSTATINLLVEGNNNGITVVTSSVPENITIIGNGNTLTFTGSASGPEKVLIVGNSDTVSNPSVSSSTEIVSFYGSYDAFNPGTVSSSTYSVYFNGFNPSSPTATCPVDNLSQSDSVRAPVGSSSTLKVNYNNTVYSGSGTGTNGTGVQWGITYKIPSPLNSCPFYSQLTQTVANTGMSGASLLLYAANTYAAAADIAYDQGAVVFAEPGGLPILVDPPKISFANGSLSVWVPSFQTLQGFVPAEAGTGAAAVYARLLSLNSISLPTGNFSVPSGSTVTLTVVTPFPAAWIAFFNSIHSLYGLATCSGVRSVCSANFQPGGPAATVSIAIPGVSSITVRYATFSVSFD